MQRKKTPVDFTLTDIYCTVNVDFTCTCMFVGLRINFIEIARSRIKEFDQYTIELQQSIILEMKGTSVFSSYLAVIGPAG